MYLLYGAGNIGNQYIKMLHSKGITDFYIADSNGKKVGQQIYGHRILAVEEVGEIENKISIAIITADDTFYDEVFEILKKVLNKVPITSYKEAIVVSAADIFDIGRLDFKWSIEPGIYSYNQFICLLDEKSFNDLDVFFYTKKHRIINKFIHYTDAYNRFFEKFRNKKIRVLEIGVYKGGSLQMWKDYFGEEAEIFGVDIEQECVNYCERNIEIFIGDQADDIFLEGIKKRLGYVDIIIDDGGHTMEQQKRTFESLFEIVRDGGIYLCEDTHTSYWKQYGGGYRETQTFIEYSKNVIDLLNEQYFDSKDIGYKYRGEIRSISFFDSMVFMEKKKYSNRSLALKCGDYSC